ncbi:peptidase S11 [Chromatium okenii]|uniref:serine hydrolase n=1 Tax=Chromatium okenii TaxID=61644 RepID=UPI0019051D51|nr:serine hydrolase [Chromatium okenii]MBK1642643.1 peptidase S11 [Chromatium okenii]
MSRLSVLRFRRWIVLALHLRQRGRILLITLLLGPLLLSSAACAAQQREELTRPALENFSQAPSSSSFNEEEFSVIEPEPRRNSAPPITHGDLYLQSGSALVMDESGNRLYSKNAQQIKPIASVTKLMTAMVVLDAGVPMEPRIEITEADRDRLRNSSSRLRIGEAVLTRREMLMAALMSSDNRAAHALGRTTFRGGMPAFVRAMNQKAKSLGMHDSYFADSSGLDARNRSSAEDLVKMVKAAGTYPFIRKTTSTGETTLYPFANQKPLLYRNTNSLVRNPEWTIEVSKTGFINEAGRCLVMQTRIGERRFYVVFLEGANKSVPLGDANRVRDWLLKRSQKTAAR